VNHLAPQPTAASDDDVVICAAYRTPITKARKGGFKDTTPDALLAAVLKGTVERSGVDATKIGDVVVGNVLQGGAGALTSRMAGFVAGIPEDVPLVAINRQCSSGLQAVANVAASIKAGFYDIGIGAGVESMTVNTMMDSVPKAINPEVFNNTKAQECMIPMGNTSENVAAKYGISRATQDAFAALSHNKAEAAQAAGWFDAEIIPVTTTINNKAGKTVADVDIFEVNEAFASQATYCVDKLNIPADKVNPKGGAIAFGHPLGATGARQVATLLHELHRTGKKSGVISMCIGTGMGAAAYIEAE